MLPKHVRYQAALHPDIGATGETRTRNISLTKRAHYHCDTVAEQDVHTMLAFILQRLALFSPLMFEEV